MKIQQIVIFGCGNVATYFAERFTQLNHTIIQVYHPEASKAGAFASVYGAESINDLSLVNQQADIYFIAVKDSFIETIANHLSISNGIVMHTSGAVPLEVMSNHARAAVFYPLQTFTKGIQTANHNFPVLIESKQKEDELYLSSLAELMGNTVHFMHSEQRKEVHLAAVFAANFANHCIKIGYDLMQQNNHEAAMLLPLIRESIHKLNFISPGKAQTGPAIRHDDITIEKHISMLNNDATLKSLYSLITSHIQTANS